MTMKRSGTAACLILCALLLWGPGAIAQEPLHARVSFDNGNSMIKGADDADSSYATINTIVMPGDTLWVDKSGTLEVEMSGGTFLRMADGSKVEVLSLAAAGGIRLWSGSVYAQRLSRSQGDIVLETPVCKVSVGRDSQVRMDVLSNGATTVSVRWGSAIIQAPGGADTAVTRGQRSYIDPGYLPSSPAPFDLSSEDDFDSWNRERSRLLASGLDSVPTAVAIKSAPIGLSDLAPYGDWVYVENAYYWRPTTVTNFVPYRNGHWSFIPGCGYVWVDDYPFCYVTTHYGRWWYNEGYGWLWTYRDTWGPAWVSSVQYGPNFVWAPLDPWDRPCSFGLDYYDVGGLHIGVGFSTYCPMNDLLVGPCVVYPCTPMIIHNVPRTEINIWNINIGSHDHHHQPFPYRDTTLRVRDYSPRRVIRGPEVIGGGSGPAHARVAGFERDGGAPERWRAVGSGDMKNTRTLVEGPARVAQPRAARIQGDVLKSGGRFQPRSMRGEALPMNLTNSDVSNRDRGASSRSSGRDAVKKQDVSPLPRPMRMPDSVGRSDDSPRNLNISKPSTRGRSAIGDTQGGTGEPPQSRGVREIKETPKKTFLPQTRSRSTSFDLPERTAPFESPGDSTRSRVTRIGGRSSASNDSAQPSLPGPRRAPTAPSLPQVSAPEMPQMPQVSQSAPTIQAPERPRLRETVRSTPEVRTFTPPSVPETRSFTRESAPIVRSEPAPIPMRVQESAPRVAPSMPSIAPRSDSSPSIRSNSIGSGSSSDGGSRDSGRRHR